MSPTSTPPGIDRKLADIDVDLDRTLSRRALLLGAVVGPVLLAGCDAAPTPSDGSLRDPGGDESGSTTNATTTTAPPIQGAEPADHLLRRATYGITPAAQAAITAMGTAAWVQQQLDPMSIDDTATDDRLAGLATLDMSPAELRDAYEMNRFVPIGELTVARYLRAVHSERQLYEVLVGFWTDHFNIDMTIGPVPFLKGADERDVIRPHAIGRFADMLAASVASPAMLVYLNNATSRADGDNTPNENHARELLELHTVGVDGGYDEEDVVEVAHVLSGWTVDRRNGEMVFNERWHSMDGVGDVLGWKPGALTGRAAGESLLDHIAHLPETATHLATKLCRRFVSDDPPPELIDRAAATYLDRDTAIGPVVEEILTSDEFARAVATKVRRPFELLAAQGRALGLEIEDLSGTQSVQRIPQALRLLGEPVYAWPSPDGPPDVGPPWLNAGTVLQRWNVTLTLTDGRLPGMSTDIERLRPTDSQNVDEFLAQFAANLGVELDPATVAAGLELLDTTSGSPAPDPSADTLADLAALILIAPSAHRR